MTREEYTQVQSQLDLLADMVNAMPLRQFLDMIGRAEAVGPIKDPTLYMRGMPTMQAFQDLAESAESFQKGARLFLAFRADLRKRLAAESSAP